MINNIEKPVLEDYFLLQKVEDKSVDLYGYIIIHKKFANQPSFGATRVWQYKNKEEMKEEALRLAKMMTYKSALAGLPYGGAKAVLLNSEGYISNKKYFFEKYAQAVDSLHGQFITGCDVGVQESDVKNMKKITPYIVGVNVDPGFYTARGVFLAMESCLYFFDKKIDWSGLKVGVEGIGKVGQPLLAMLIDKGASVIISEIDKEKIESIKKHYPQVEVEEPDKLWQRELDIFSPCALGGVISQEKVDKFKCRMIIGSANNQLENFAVGDQLYEKGIYYAPDFLVNSGGLISVVTEYAHSYDLSKFIEQALEKMIEKLFNINKLSQQKKVAWHRLALSMAEKEIGGEKLEK